MPWGASAKHGERAKAVGRKYERRGSTRERRGAQVQNTGCVQMPWGASTKDVEVGAKDKKKQVHWTYTKKRICPHRFHSDLRNSTFLQLRVTRSVKYRPR